MISVGEFCNRRVITIARTETVVEAARRMRAHHVGSLVIVEDVDGKVMPVGLITDRDIVVGVVATASPYLQTLTVGEIVTNPLITARERHDLASALVTMRAHGIRRMPVVDEAGALVGIVAYDDILELLSDQLGELAALLSRERRHEAERRSA